MVDHTAIAVGFLGRGLVVKLPSYSGARSLSSWRMLTKETKEPDPSRDAVARLLCHRSGTHLPSLGQICIMKKRTRHFICWWVQRNKRHRSSASSCSRSYRQSHDRRGKKRWNFPQLSMMGKGTKVQGIKRFS